MRTVSYEQILFPALQLCGLDRDLATNQRFVMLRDLVNMRLRTIWEMHEWTDLKKIEKCTTTLVDGRRSVNLPVGFGQIIAIWTRDPVAQNSVQKDFDLVADKVYLKNDLDEYVWVESRLECPYLDGETWSVSTTYPPGAKAYNNGNFYENTSATNQTGGSAPSANSNWTLIEIPKLFANSLIYGLLADYRRSTGEIELAQAAEQDCQRAIDAALDQTLRQQGSIRPINFRGY